MSNDEIERDLRGFAGEVLKDHIANAPEDHNFNPVVEKRALDPEQQVGESSLQEQGVIAAQRKRDAKRGRKDQKKLRKVAREFKFKPKKRGPKPKKANRCNRKTLILNPPVFIDNLRACLINRRKVAKCGTIET